MRKRNDYLQKLIADNFMLDDVRKSQAVTSRPELTAFVIDQKRVDTKQKEMQTKLFQDL
jgi:D-tyrosyl-tRNA(Tyr) deacylase